MGRRKRRIIERRERGKLPKRKGLSTLPVCQGEADDEPISACPEWDLPRFEDEKFVEVDGYWEDDEAIIEAAKMVGAKVIVNEETGDVTTELPEDMRSHEGVKRFSELVLKIARRRAGMMALIEGSTN